MKTKLRIVGLAFLAGVMLATMQPTLLFGGASGGGNIWDPYVYTAPFEGKELRGPLSIYLDMSFWGAPCSGGSALLANMYFTIRLKLDKDKTNTLWAFQGSSLGDYPNGICVTDLADMFQEITKLLDSVIPNLTIGDPPKLVFPYGVNLYVNNGWKVTAIDNPAYNDDPVSISRVFIADIEITVKGNPKPKKH